MARESLLRVLAILVLATAALFSLAHRMEIAPVEVPAASTLECIGLIPQRAMPRTGGRIWPMGWRTARPVILRAMRWGLRKQDCGRTRAARWTGGSRRPDADVKAIAIYFSDTNGAATREVPASTSPLAPRANGIGLHEGLPGLPISRRTGVSARSYWLFECRQAVAPHPGCPL